MEKVVIFGAGNCGRLIATNLDSSNEIIAFIDNDSQKAGKTIKIDSGGGSHKNLLLLGIA